MNKQRNCLLIIVLFAFLIVSCDLFTSPNTDLFRTISEEADWANAPKLTVRIDYPSVWGISNPPQGGITPAKDIRLGYEFSVEFIPEPAYTLMSWQVYRTAELREIGNWLVNLSLLDPDVIQPLGPGEVKLPAPDPSGGNFNFTIYTTDPVTLIPRCDTQPRITGTEPCNRPDGQPYSNTRDITIYFNCALDASSVKFADAQGGDGIWITAKSLDSGAITDNKGNNWFYEPAYAVVDGFFTVTMNTMVNSLPPENSLMTVTVKGIKNMQGETGGEYTFSWNTSSVTNVYFSSYNA